MNLKKIILPHPYLYYTTTHTSIYHNTNMHSSFFCLPTTYYIYLSQPIFALIPMLPRMKHLIRENKKNGRPAANRQIKDFYMSKLLDAN